MNGTLTLHINTTHVCAQNYKWLDGLRMKFMIYGQHVV